MKKTDPNTEDLTKGSSEDLTQGPLLKKLLVFVLPLILTNFLQFCYSAADMIVVGFSDVEGAIGAIGTTNAMINLVLNTFIGLSVGANVIVSRNIGKGDREAVSRAVHTSLLVSLFCGVICVFIGLAINRPILTLMGDQGHVLDLAVTYSSLYFAGAPFLAATNFLSAIFRAKGDTKTPLAVLTMAGLVNVILNFFFVLGFGMSVDGVAIATAISNLISAVVLTVLLSRDKGMCRFSFKKLRVTKQELVDIIYIGLPAGLQGAVFDLSNMLLQSSIIGINNVVCPGGSAIIDGNAAASSLEGFAYTATNSVYQGAVTFVSQHYGAKKYRRIWKVQRCCYLTSAVIALICMGIIFGFRPLLVGLYVDNDLAMQAAFTRINIVIGSYVLLSAMETGSGVLRGLGRSLTSTIVSLLGSCALRVVWVFTVFRAFPTLEVVYLCYPISWLVTSLTHLICSVIVRRRLIRRSEENKNFEEEPIRLA